VSAVYRGRVGSTAAVSVSVYYREPLYVCHGSIMPELRSIVNTPVQEYSKKYSEPSTVVTP
jgi:hypothetical protein